MSLRCGVLADTVLSMTYKPLLSDRVNPPLLCRKSRSGGTTPADQALVG